MAKNANNGGGSGPKSKTAEEYDILRRQSKVGKNKVTKVAGTPTVSPATLVKMFDDRARIVRFALATPAIKKLVDSSKVQHEIALQVIETYAEADIKGGNLPLEKHLVRVKSARDSVTRDNVIPAVEIACKALNEGSAYVEGLRKRELARLTKAQKSPRIPANAEVIADIVARFTPAPVVATELETVEASTQGELVSA